MLASNFGQHPYHHRQPDVLLLLFLLSSSKNSSFFEVFCLSEYPPNKANTANIPFNFPFFINALENVSIRHKPCAVL